MNGHWVSEITWEAFHLSNLPTWLDRKHCPLLRQRAEVSCEKAPLVNKQQQKRRRERLPRWGKSMEKKGKEKKENQMMNAERRPRNNQGEKTGAGVLCAGLCFRDVKGGVSTVQRMT